MTTAKLRFRRLSRLPIFVLIGALVFSVAACADVSGPRVPATVLVLRDEQTETGVMQILESAGIDAVLGPRWWEVTEADLTGHEKEFDAVVFLSGYEYFRLMTVEGQEAIVNFVAAGGGLLATEYLSWYPTRNPVLTAILPAYGSGEESAPETYTRVRTHAITRGIPASFLTAADWTSVLLAPDTAAAKAAQVIYEGSNFGAPTVVAGRWVEGRIVSWGMGGTYVGTDIWGPETERLLVNIVNWVSRR